MLANIALPITNAFVGEFLIFLGIYQFNTWLMAIAGLSIIFGAVYMLFAYQKICLGETNEITLGFKDLTLSEKFTIIPIAMLIFIFGIFPQPILNLTQHLINEIVSKIQ